MCGHNSKNMKSTCILLLPPVNLTQYKKDKQKPDHKNRQNCSCPSRTHLKMSFTSDMELPCEAGSTRLCITGELIEQGSQ